MLALIVVHVVLHCKSVPLCCVFVCAKCDGMCLRVVQTILWLIVRRNKTECSHFMWIIHLTNATKAVEELALPV
jgi:hypothetical protein